MSPVISIIVPTFGRAERLNRVAANIHQATSTEHEILIVAERTDEGTVFAACREPGVIPVINTRSRNYAGAINTGFQLASGQYIFTGADDLNFHPGWDKAALDQMTGDIRVVGTNDLLNDGVLRGVHATHYLIDRRYIEDPGAVVDAPPRTVLFQGYDHQYSDTEAIGTARARGVFAPCLESIVEHMHFTAGRSLRDATYDKGFARVAQDAELFAQREHLWTQESMYPEAIEYGKTVTQ